MILFRAENKRNGSMSEWNFCIACARQDINLYRATTEHTCSDFISEYEKTLKRVQVRSCSYEEESKNSYKFSACVGGSKTKLTDTEVDFIAAHIVSHDLWYIIPINEIEGKSFRLSPGSTVSIYEKYRQRWDLLK